MKTIFRTLLLCAALAAPVPALAQAAASSADRPFLNPLFSDDMVLQRGQSDPVWGWTTPGATVRVSIAGKGAQARGGRGRRMDGAPAAAADGRAVHAEGFGAADRHIQQHFGRRCLGMFRAVQHGVRDRQHDERRPRDRPGKLPQDTPVHGAAQRQAGPAGDRPRRPLGGLHPAERQAGRVERLQRRRLLLRARPSREPARPHRPDRDRLGRDPRRGVDQRPGPGRSCRTSARPSRS